jgi:ubiquinone/menaquinone biosynthesis C-methylase UbiE
MGDTYTTESDGERLENGVKASVRRQFTQVAAHYRNSPIHAQGSDLAEMVKAARLLGRERILDAGCGPGHTALAFAPFAAGVIALDLAEEMLAQGRSLAAQRGIVNVEFRRGDVERLPFGAAEFDLVISRYSAHHWPEPVAALREFRRVLRPQGTVLLADIVSWDDFIVDTHLQAFELLRDASHVRDHTVSAWFAMLERAGFEVELAHEWQVYIDFASWVERMATPDQAVAMLQTLLGRAPEEVQKALAIQADGSFTMQGALFRAQSPA